MKPDIDKLKRSKLSFREQKALLIYISNKFENITSACIDAGYAEKSAHNTGSKLLQKKESVALLAQYAEKALQKYLKTADDVLDELSVIAFSDFGNFFYEDVGGGISMKSLSQLGRHSRAIKEIKHIKKDFFDSSGDITQTMHEYTYKLHDKVKALEHLGHHHHLYNKLDQPTGESTDKMLPMIYLPDNGKGGKALIAVEYKAN